MGKNPSLWFGALSLIADCGTARPIGSSALLPNLKNGFGGSKTWMALASISAQILADL
jgi:hypothetical protein